MKIVPGFIDITSQRFGRLTVIKRGENKSGRPAWLCQCDCGSQKTIIARNLRSGIATSCGCKARELSSARARTHGMTNTREFRIWTNIKTRCFNKASKDYKNYGGRGISMAHEWAEDFQSFLVSVGRAPPSMTIERIDNDLGYVPGNVRWASRKEQARNRRSCRFIMVAGVKMTVVEASEKFSVNEGTILYRLNKGLTGTQSVGMA